MKTLAFVWSSFGPYHVARCEAVAAIAPANVRILGIELAPRTHTYEWLPTIGSKTFQRASLTDGYAESVTAREAFSGLRRVLHSRSCDAIFLPSYWPAPNLALLAAARSLNIPTVMMNDSHQGTAREGLMRHAAKMVIVRQFDAALVGGTKQSHHFRRLGVASDRIFLGYDAVDNGYFEAASDGIRRESESQRKCLRLPRRFVLSLGRLVPKKNVDTVIEAFVKYRRQVPDGAALVIVGSGPCEDALEHGARALGLRVVDRRTEITEEHGDVYFYGFRQIDQNPTFYALADAFVLASTHEEWGLVVNEAMACATPVIVSNAVGCSDDLIAEGITGWSFNPHDASRLAALFERVLSDPERLKAAGASAREHVRAWGCEKFAANALRAAEVAGGSKRAAHSVVRPRGSERLAKAPPVDRLPTSRKVVRPATPELLLVWSNLGPYHLARCAGLADAAGEQYRVTALQLGRESSVYPWQSPRQRADVTVLDVSDGMAEDVGPVAVFRAVLRLIRTRNIHAVFVPGYWPPTSLAVLAAARWAGRPAVMMSASHDGAGSSNWVKNRIKRALVRRFDAALVGGSRHQKHFVSMGLPSECVFPAYDVVDNTFFITASFAARSSGEVLRHQMGLPHRYFLNLGRQVRKKNLSVLLHAFDLVRRKHSDCPRLVLVGGGPERKRILTVAAELGLSVCLAPERDESAHIYIFPFAQIDQTPAYYALAEAFILPSTVEEWGLVVNEAMAAGVPVLVSRAAGCCEDLIRHGHNGFIFDPSSAAELAAYMERFILDPSLRQRMAAATSPIIAAWSPDLFGRNAIAAVHAASESPAA